MPSPISKFDRKAFAVSDIQTLRGSRSRAEFAELVGVSPLTVYRWELPDDAAEARRPRGKVLARLRAFAEGESTPTHELAPLPASGGASVAFANDELAAFEPAFADIEECRLELAEEKLVSLVNAGTVRSEAGRALASVMLARVHLLARQDTKGAFATLLGATPALTRLPRIVQLEYHLTAGYLHALADAQLFNPGKTHHHAVLAEQLITEGNGDHRFFLWYAQYTAAVSLYDIALIARAVEGLAMVRELASTALHRCLCMESATLSSLGMMSPAEGARRLEEFEGLAEKLGLPLQQLRSLTWRAEVAVEEARAPSEILALLERAEGLQRRHRIAHGIHTMLTKRNQGETLLRLGELRRAEEVLIEAVQVAREISYTPIRIYTTLARLYVQTDRADLLRKLAFEASAAADAQKEITQAFGRMLCELCDLYVGDASADSCDRLLEHLAGLRRLGVWPVAYRHLALLALSIGASRTTAGDAERLAHAAERAVEISASPTATAAYRRHRATVLMRRGKLTEARQALLAALATLEASGDVAEAALVRHALANVDLLEGSPSASLRLTERQAELSTLGLPIPKLIHADAVHLDEPLAALTRSTAEPTHVERLVVPVQRLSTRGVGHSFLEKELVNVAAELFPGRTVALHEVDDASHAVELARRDCADSSVAEWFELGDGLGRSLRLGIAGPVDPKQRALLEVLVATAGLALEVAALRALPATPRGPGPLVSESEPKVLADFIARSPSMLRLKAELGRLSSSRATIIITGESGTGKEVVARAVHELSRRAGRPYVTFNSAAVPRELFEGQLFGHRKGAFTGASNDHAGVIRSADGGTLFLDEIGELPLDVQPKLLRFLENGEVLPLGAREAVRVDVRVITATHRDLRSLVREGKFREDLYYRLQVVPVEVAPLRERREDIIVLARHFMRRLTPVDAPVPVLTTDAEARLLAHAWPGNVRELRNVIERCMAFEPLPRSIGASDIRI